MLLIVGNSSIQFLARASAYNVRRNDTRQTDYITLSLILRFRFGASFFFFLFFARRTRSRLSFRDIIARSVGERKIGADYSTSFTDNGNELESTATVIIFGLRPATDLILRRARRNCTVT